MHGGMELSAYYDFETEPNIRINFNNFEQVYHRMSTSNTLKFRPKTWTENREKMELVFRE